MNQPLGVTTEINLHTPVLLPDSYCGDIHERLVLYKRFANCSNSDELDDLHAELVDRFGLLPEPAQALLESHRLRLLAKPLGIAKLDASTEAVSIQFVPNPPINPARIIELIQTRRNFKLAGQDKLRVTVAAPTLANRVENIRKLFKELS